MISGLFLYSSLPYLPIVHTETQQPSGNIFLQWLNIKKVYQDLCPDHQPVQVALSHRALQTTSNLFPYYSH